MTLQEGLYMIRYVPPHVKLPFDGGMYVTGDDINMPLRGEGLNPTAVTGEQTWKVSKVEGSDGLYTIGTPGFTSSNLGIGPVLAGWGYRSIRSDEPVLFTVNLKEWTIQRNEDDGTYVIKAPTSLIGVGFFVGAESNSNIALQTISVIPDHLPIPRWEFNLQESKE